jgi:crotonobetainyl-CoA:carnitine CoA-transferase CaiB-like acyl-CoA transferase
MEAPHLTERGILYEAEDPVDGKMPRLASPVVVDGERAKPLAPAPRHGEHDDEVLTRR